MYKIGTKVKIINNSTLSSHKIGQTGKIVRAVESSIKRLVPDRNDYNLYLIEVNGYYDEGGTWSYQQDLKLIASIPLNTIVL